MSEIVADGCECDLCEAQAVGWIGEARTDDPRADDDVLMVCAFHAAEFSTEEYHAIG